MEKEAQYIIDESQEVSVGETKGWVQTIFRAFPAFAHRNYRLYFFGQLISLIGTWLGQVALGWFVFELTQSALWVGIISALLTLPILLFSLFGGVLVDRLSKKKIIIFTQASSLILTAILGILTVFGAITVTQIAVLAFLLGLVDALDKPARQAFVVEMVGKEDLASAIALNSGVFNSARVIGPGIAGVIIALFGSGGAFVLNAVSYIPVVLAMCLISVSEKISSDHPHPLLAIQEGISYAISHPVIRLLLFYTAVMSIFGWSYSTIMPVVVRNIFFQDASVLGYFFASSGLGALLGSVIISLFAKKVGPLFFILLGNFCFVGSLFLFTLTTSLFPAFVLLFIAGFGLILQFATINTTIQHLVEDRMRGRVMSLYVLMFMGMTPVGSFQIGYITQHFGAQTAIRIGCFVLFLAMVFLFLKKKSIEAEYRKHAGV